MISIHFKEKVWKKVCTKFIRKEVIEVLHKDYKGKYEKIDNLYKSMINSADMKHNSMLKVQQRCKYATAPTILSLKS